MHKDACDGLVYIRAAPTQANKYVSPRQKQQAMSTHRLKPSCFPTQAIALSPLRLGKNNREPRTEPKEPEPKPKEPEPKISVPDIEEPK